MANLAFSSQGAVPQTGSSQLSPGLGGGSTPAANALNNSDNGAAISKATIAPPTPVQSNPYLPGYTGHTPTPTIPAATTPVKSTSITYPDGTKHVTTHAAADTGSTSATAPANGGYSTVAGPYDPVTGLLKPTTQPSVTSQSTSAVTPSTPSTYAGMVGNLNTTSQEGSPQGKTYTDQTAAYGAGNLPIGQSAKDIAADYGNRIAQVGQAGAQFRSGQLTTGTSPIAQGNAAITAQSTTAQQQALATGEEAALQGTAQQLTGQNQAATASNAAAGQANTAQGNVQSGLTSAGTLAKPGSTTQGQTTYDPLTNSFSGGSYQQNLQTVVDSIKNGNMGYTEGVNSLAGLSPTAKADVLAQLGIGFDTIASDANATARASNISTGGTAITGANAAGLATAIQEQANLQTQTSSAKTLADQVSKAVSDSGLSLTNSTDANTAINNLQSRLGNDAYTKLNIAVNDARNAYAAILNSTGATPTDAGNAATQNINANMSPKQIIGAIDQLNSGLYARQKAADEKVKHYNNQLNATSSTNPSRSPSGSGGSLDSATLFPGFN